MAAITSLRSQPTSCGKSKRRLYWHPLISHGEPCCRGQGEWRFVGVSAWALTRFDAPSKVQTPESCPSTDLSAEQKELIISNWQAYIDEPDEDDPQPTTIDDFEEATGIKVSYSDDVTDNNDFFAKVQNQLGSCQTVKRDMFMLTDWMAAKMIDLGWIQKLDHANMPNVDANLLPNLQGCRVRPRAPVLRAVAERLHRHRLQRGVRRRGRRHSKSSSPARISRARSPC